MSIYKNGKLIAGGRQCMPLLSFMWADHVLNDVSWLRADTFSWQSGAVYQAAYQHLADDIDGKTLQSETIGSTTIQFYLADDGHKICPASEESNVMTIYAATGVAWYYIIDTANTRFKLPRTQFAFTGIRSGVGAFVEAGLPNITDTLNNVLFSPNGASASGARRITSSASFAIRNDGANEFQGNSSFDASNSNSIYGNSNTVQPKATEMYLYFYVGNFTQTALENTAGLNAELFNDKLDITTFDTDGVKYCSFNTDTRIQITTTDQTATKNGWLIGLINFSGSNKNVEIYVNSLLVGRYGWSGSQWFAASVCLPIKAGQTYRFACSGTVEQNQMYFYPND